jgi:rubrerythrin
MRGEYNADSDYPVHEKYTKLGRKKEVFEDHLMEAEKTAERHNIQTYKCSCGYAFQKKEAPKQCPYCGKGPASFDKELSAEELLEDADDEDAEEDASFDKK